MAQSQIALRTSAARQVEDIAAAPCSGLFPHPGPLPWGEGELSSPRSTIQTFRHSLRGARCSLSLRERVRVRGSGVNDPLTYRTIPGTVELDESPGEAGGFPK